MSLCDMETTLVCFKMNCHFDEWKLYFSNNLTQFPYDGPMFALDLCRIETIRNVWKQQNVLDPYQDNGVSFSYKFSST